MSAGPPRGPPTGSTCPAPSAAASRVALWSVSVSQTSEPRSRSASAIDVPIRPVPTTTADAGPSARVMDFPARSLRDVQPQGGSAAQIDVLHLRPGQAGFDVHHQPHHPRHGTGHVALRPPQQRPLLKPDRPPPQPHNLSPQPTP